MEISNIQLELELRELRKKLICNDLIKYLSSKEEIEEPDTEKYDNIISTNIHYLYNPKDYDKHSNIHRFKCL